MARLMHHHRHYLAVHHIWAAAFFAREAVAVETKKDRALATRDEPQHRAYVMGAVSAAVCFLDATINQVFKEAHDQNVTDYLLGLAPADIEMLGKNWTRDTSFKGVLEKHRYALLLLGKSPLPTNGFPFEGAEVLVALRNELTHFEPEWVIADRDRMAGDRPHELGDRLRDRFELSPLPGSTFFPDKVLGYGCAKWAVNTALAYADAWHKAVGLTKPIYEPIRAHLATE